MACAGECGNEPSGSTKCDMAGAGEIKYPGQTKTSTAVLQFDIDLSRAKGRKP
jgi:hypothetical protein